MGCSSHFNLYTKGYHLLSQLFPPPIKKIKEPFKVIRIPSGFLDGLPTTKEDKEKVKNENFE